MKAFFDTIRAKFGPMSKEQVQGIHELVTASSGLPIRHRAYVMATAWHETAATMQPITERGGKTYFNKYDAGTKIGSALGNTVKGDGFMFRGRGYVQITGRRNYAKASHIVGVDLVASPDRALEARIAGQIIIAGMRDGWFTGKRMADYADFKSMRRVVNGTDKAAMIAGYAETFLAALQKLPDRVSVAPAPVTPPKPEIEAQTPKESIPQPSETAKPSIGPVVAVGGAAAAAAASHWGGVPWLIGGGLIAATAIVILFVIYIRKI